MDHTRSQTVIEADVVILALDKETSASQRFIKDATTRVWAPTIPPPPRYSGSLYKLVDDLANKLPVIRCLAD